MKISLIITAGGVSSRFGRNKLLEKINGKEVIFHTLEAFSEFEFDKTIITASDELAKFLEKNTNRQFQIVNGGATRQQSVYNALKMLDNPDFVVIHDAARPVIKKDIIKNCIDKAIETKAAIVAVKAIDTIKVVDKNGEILSTPDRNTLYCVQTPQVFDYKLIFDAHKKFEGQNYSDDAGMLETLGYNVFISDGDYKNIKITTQNDIEILSNYLK